jgi:hypothetical protein
MRDSISTETDGSRIRRGAPSSGARRFAGALLLAIAVHALLASIARAPRASSEPQREIVTHVTIARIAPRPAPSPTPTPHAAPRRHAVVTVPAAARVPVPLAAGKAARPLALHHAGAARPKPPVLHRVAVTAIPVGAQGAGAGSRSGAGSLGNGSGGSGTGAGGNGSGAGGGNEPCGYVEFSDPNGTRADAATGGWYVDVSMSVHFADGRNESLMLDYPWYYRTEAANPWSRQNVGDPDFPTTFQFPPPDKRAGEPPLVQYVMAHTTPGGYTRLKDCSP